MNSKKIISSLLLTTALTITAISAHALAEQEKCYGLDKEHPNQAVLVEVGTCIEKGGSLVPLMGEENQEGMDKKSEEGLEHEAQPESEE